MRKIRADAVAEICWAPRAPKRLIRRLYESEASGLLDEDLVDEAGIALYLRAESILNVGEAQRGRVRCPRCQRGGRKTVIARHGWEKSEVLRCRQCRWSVMWGEYLKTFQGKQLSEGKAGDYLRTFMASYRAARSARDKMLAIDRLIHEFHHNLVNGALRPTRAVCVNRIKGKLTDVVAFLDELGRGRPAAPEIAATRARWLAMLRGMPWDILNQRSSSAAERPANDA